MRVDPDPKAIVSRSCEQYEDQNGARGCYWHQLRGQDQVRSIPRTRVEFSSYPTRCPLLATELGPEVTR